MAAKRQPVTYPDACKPLDLTAEEAPPPPPVAAPAAPDVGTPPSRRDKRAVTFYLPRDKWLALRTTSLRLGRPTHELMAEATDWLASREGAAPRGDS